MDNTIKEIIDNISKVMIGQEKTEKLLLSALIAGGHVLIEDVPGMGKTVMARALAKSINAEFRRIQFTPDLLPSDVTGINYFDRKQNEFIFQKGPAFCNILLADEINRATPRTQSSLLECMAEQQITVEGITRPLEKPFFVIATQNPLETLGTYPLPEAQMDRFLMRISMESPSKENEISILERFMKDEPLSELAQVCDNKEILNIQDKVKDIYVNPILLGYIAEISQKSRSYSTIQNGISPRGTLALLNASRAWAMIEGREFVIPEDIKTVAIPVLAHRISITGTIATTGEQNKLMNELLNTIEVPTEDWSRR